MDQGSLVVLALVLFGWAVSSERLARVNLTGPMVLLAAGFVLGNPDWGPVDLDVESSTVHHLSEITLGLLLFADASTIRLAAARRDLGTTSRLLGVGLPLSILAGTGLAVLAFPEMPLALAGVVGAGLAPTDAALSASVIADERLPARIRRVVNVESGLNDGIATPVVTSAITAAAAALGSAARADDSGVGALGELALGVVIGGGVAAAGGWLVSHAHRRRWMAQGARGLAALALALVAFLLAASAGGNPFVAAFVGGLLLGAVAPSDVGEARELTETVGGLLSLALWFVFGAGFLATTLERVDARIVVYAVVSLTAVRMVPVALSLIGSGDDRATAAFIGWFGPRGLASVVFAFLAVEELGGTDPRAVTAIDTIVFTVLLSVIAHGLTARPLATRYVAHEAGGSQPPPARSRDR